ncbi:hypothetical protein SCATT_15310 [Streptantibioticus cattleyicolor NRRL 8057 = DSM 46488]|uniref:Uncharacterized protein n=1 Tax=Streptantibioticus cattleyicolor (strain ATCC 35852 / DSM 46488 / JCM 4925 / NBRC 14057 / NRRL 8057) TaxID=1003195 RepID=G8X216_STREN|nr:hypothetical protein SCATT_15310 [Streptantibioticus cattleyicolor NRRL 8057 = DSM 46488]
MTPVTRPTAPETGRSRTKPPSKNVCTCVCYPRGRQIV